MRMTRKSDREACAARFAALAEECKARFDRVDGLWGPHSVSMTLTKGPWAVSFEVSGNTAVGCWLGHWHHVGPAAETLPPGFGVVGDVNRFHCRKATTQVVTDDEFRRAIAKGFMLLDAEAKL